MQSNCNTSAGLGIHARTGEIETTSTSISTSTTVNYTTNTNDSYNTNTTKCQHRSITNTTKYTVTYV